MVLLDARPKPEMDSTERRLAEATVDQPIGTPTTYENDGKGGLRKKPTTASEPTVLRGAPTKITLTTDEAEELLSSRTYPPAAIKRAARKYADASLDYHFAAEQCRTAERAKDAAFAELLATSDRGGQQAGNLLETKWDTKPRPIDKDIEAVQKAVNERAAKPPEDSGDVFEAGLLTEEAVLEVIGEGDPSVAETLKMPSTTDPPTETPDTSDGQNELDADPPLSLGGISSPPAPPAPPDPLAGSDWRSVTTDAAGIPEPMCILLKDQPNQGDSITTLGQLIDFTLTYELTGLARIGQRKSDVIVKAMVKFWEENPEMGAAYLEEFPPEEEEGTHA